jgi:hypothetical protein
MHRDLYYLSERLTRDVVDSANAGKKLKIKTSFSARTPGPVGPGVKVESEEPSRANPHALAQAALEAVGDEAGDFAQPGRWIHLLDVQVKIWVYTYVRRPRHKKAAVVSIELPTSLAVLIGGAYNVFGHSKELPIDGWIPSDPIGVKKIFDAWGSTAQDGAEPGPQSGDALEDAAYIAYSLGRTPDRDTRADVLAQVYDYADDVEVASTRRGHRRTFKRVILGTPLFVREPEARALHL